MDRKITRRDFLDGAALTIGGVMLAGSAIGGTAAAVSGCASSAGAVPAAPGLDDYPPDLVGLQGQTDAARYIPHLLRDGKFWGAEGSAQDTGESYDLIVVGGGFSGMATAYFCIKNNPNARVLVLENHAEVGGHARRNEFTPLFGRRSRLLIADGGTANIDHPNTYSPTAKAVLEDIGVDPQRLGKYSKMSVYGRYGLVNEAEFFDKETWGTDCLAVRTPRMPTAAYVKRTPLSEQAKKDLVMITDHPKDWMAGMTQSEKFQKLSEITYSQYLTDYAKVDPDVLKYLSTQYKTYWGYGIDAIGAIDAWADGNPGFSALKLSWDKPSKYNAPTEKQFWQEGPVVEFPDGAAGAARLMVRALIPEALPGSTMEDQVLARLDYDKLDLPTNQVRIRLGSPVARVRNVGDVSSATGVEVFYVQGKDLKRVQAKGVVMACHYTMLPYIVDGMPEKQKMAARFMTHIPLLYANTPIRNWHAFEKLKISGVHAIGPNAFWLMFRLDSPVSMGGYQHPTDPDQPVTLHWAAAPAKLGVDPRQGCRMGRQELMGMSFADLERKMRDVLARSLGSAGFDPANDILAITINRWAHGYAFEYAMPWDKAFYPDGPLPGEVAATPLGRITFAGTDRSSRAYIDSAIDAAYKAVNEQSG